MKPRLERPDLLEQQLDQPLAGAARHRRDVVDRLVRIELDALAADPIEVVDQLALHVEQARPRTPRTGRSARRRRSPYRSGSVLSAPRPRSSHPFELARMPKGRRRHGRQHPAVTYTLSPPEKRAPRRRLFFPPSPSLQPDQSKARIDPHGAADPASPPSPGSPVITHKWRIFDCQPSHRCATSAPLLTCPGEQAAAHQQNQLMLTSIG